MRPLPWLAAVLLLATVLPAAAQTGQFDTRVAVDVASLGAPLDAHGVEVPVEIQYTWTAGIATTPTQIDLHVVDAPPWLAASVSPATVFVDVLGETSRGKITVVARPHETPMLALALLDGAPAGDVGSVKIQAVARENGNLKASTGADAVLVQVAEAAEEPCHHALADDEAAAAAEPAPVVEEVEAQSAAVAPVSAPLVGGLALAGAAGGAWAAFRRARP